MVKCSPFSFPDSISADILAAAAKLFTRLRLIRMSWKPRPVALYHDRSPSFSQGLGIDRVEGFGGVAVAGAGEAGLALGAEQHRVVHCRRVRVGDNPVEDIRGHEGLTVADGVQGRR